MLKWLDIFIKIITMQSQRVLSWQFWLSSNLQVNLRTGRRISALEEILLGEPHRHFTYFYVGDFMNTSQILNADCTSLLSNVVFHETDMASSVGKVTLNQKIPRSTHVGLVHNCSFHFKSRRLWRKNLVVVVGKMLSHQTLGLFKLSVPYILQW